MDLLCRAYAAASDDDDDKEDIKKSTEPQISPPSSKRMRSSSSSSSGYYSRHHLTDINRFSSNLDQSPPVLAAAAAEGRYVSKRERAMMSSSRVSDPSVPPTNSHTVSTSPAHLLASAGMDQTVHVWNVWCKDQKNGRIFRYHNAAIKDVRWSLQGLSLLSCGYDCTSRLVDVEKGAETQVFKEDQVVEAIRFHPSDSSLFISGGSKGILRLWDTRCGKVVHEYVKGLGPILDIEFSADGKQFISSTDTSRSRISEDSIIVWDVSRQVPLSNQVYGEAYTCPCVRYHPSGACFIAQSNANYIAIFSARPPFKLDKYKRYEGHGVWGFPIKCNFSCDGRELASGSSDGCIYFYDYRSAKFVRKIKAFGEACIDVAFHPLIPNVIASCSWAGEVCVFE